MANKMVWLGGKNAGKSVASTPIVMRREHVSYKLDPEAARTEQQQKLMEDPDWVRTQAEYHKHMGEGLESLYTASVMAKQNPRLVASSHRPSPWPQRFGIALVFLLVVLVSALTVRVFTLSTSPTLPSPNRPEASGAVWSRSEPFRNGRGR